MAVAQTLPSDKKGNVAELLDALVAQDGTGAHGYVKSGKLQQGPQALRNLADAVHFLCMLHGRYPGIIDHAARKTVDKDARKWLAEAADAFGRERAYLSQLVSAVGPLPSTTGQAQCETAVGGQRHALEMLAESDRSGCALGAAMALTLEWRTIRVLLDISADRLEKKIPACTLPDLRETARLAIAVSESPAIERALVFGAQQVVAQHKGLWDLLEAREAARVLR
jgi:hypothetical protein